MTSNSSAPESEYTEALATFRHWGGLRFGKLVLFAAINAGLAAVAYAISGPAREPGIPLWGLPSFLTSAGMVLALLFLGLEVGLSAQVWRLRSFIVSRWPGCHLVSAPGWTFWVPVVLYPVAYLLVFWFWKTRLPMELEPVF